MTAANCSIKDQGKIIFVILLHLGLAPSSLLKDPASFSVDVAAFMGKLWWEDKASQAHLVSLELSKFAPNLIC